MKRFFYLVLLVPVLFSSCESKKQREEINKLKQEQADLLIEARQKDSLVNEFLLAINEIESNISEIKSRESLISKETSKGNELNKNSKDRISEDFLLINDLLLKNKEKIQNLTNSLKSSNIKIGELDKMLAAVNSKLNEKEEEITALKGELSNLNVVVRNLSDTIRTVKSEKEAYVRATQQLEEEVTSKTDELNKAYYVIDSKKTLIANGILNKEGGFIGLGRKLIINNEIDLDKFTQVDIRNLKSIPIGVKDIEIISSHATDSYELVKNGKNIVELVITNPNKFWKNSRVLIISK